MTAASSAKNAMRLLIIGGLVCFIGVNLWPDLFTFNDIDFCLRQEYRPAVLADGELHGLGYPCTLKFIRPLIDLENTPEEQKGN